MGLDMYAWAVPGPIVEETDYEPIDCKIKEQLAQWRKFNHLHGWMERLYRHKGGTGDIFNCDSVQINEEDLTALELAISFPADQPVALTPTPGFFFGGPIIEPEHIEETKQFIVDARAAIKEGKVVFYDSWW